MHIYIAGSSLGYGYMVEREKTAPQKMAHGTGTIYVKIEFAVGTGGFSSGTERYSAPACHPTRERFNISSKTSPHVNTV